MWFSGTVPSCLSGVRLLLPCYTWILHKLADIKFRTMYRCDTYNMCHIMSGSNDTMSTLCLFLFSFISYESSRIWPRIVFISNISLQLGYWYSVHVAILFNSLTIEPKAHSTMFTTFIEISLLEWLLFPSQCYFYDYFNIVLASSAGGPGFNPQSRTAS